MNTGTLSFLARVASPQMWSECSWVMRMAEISRGSRPSDFSLLNVSRHESPASTKMRALELSTIAVFPRLPLASTETETAMFGSIPLTSVETGVTVWLSCTLGQAAPLRLLRAYIGFFFQFLLRRATIGLDNLAR